MDMSRTDTSELRKALEHREAMLQIAAQGTGSTAELERGIQSLRDELEARAARLAAASP
jgi:hypothetical protein